MIGIGWALCGRCSSSIGRPTASKLSTPTGDASPAPTTLSHGIGRYSLRQCSCSAGEHGCPQSGQVNDFRRRPILCGSRSKESRETSVDTFSCLRAECRGPNQTSLPISALDGADLSAADLVEVLVDFEAEYEDEGSIPAGVIDGAQWILRRIEEAGDVGDLAPASVPMIARQAGSYRFTREPVIVNNPVLAEVWADTVAVYAGDRDLDRILAALNVPLLDDRVHVEPVCGDRQPELEEDVHVRLDDAAPALIALAVKDVPSRSAAIAHKLKGLKIICSADVMLQYKLEPFEPRIDETATAFLGADGTAYLQTDGVEPDWPSFALRLAEYLDVESGDGFAFVLTSVKRVREGFLRAHRISEDDLSAAADSYDADPEPESDLAEHDLDQPSDHEWPLEERVAPSLEVEEPAPATSEPIDQHDSEPSSETPSSSVAGTSSGTGRSSEQSSDQQADGTTVTRGQGHLGQGQPHDANGSGRALRITATPRSRTQPSGPQASPSSEDDDGRFFSYVVARGSPEARLAERAESEAMRIGARGVEQVIAYEASVGRTAEPQYHSNKGFDIISARPDGTERRVIEVKATSRAWPSRGIPVSKHQIDNNVESGDEFWLYVVEYATDPERARVIPIQNPAAEIDYYVFDSGWAHAADLDR
jgi:Domain of unknown function (DUF3883)